MNQQRRFDGTGRRNGEWDRGDGQWTLFYGIKGRDCRIYP